MLTWGLAEGLCVAEVDQGPVRLAAGRVPLALARPLSCGLALVHPGH